MTSDIELSLRLTAKDLASNVVTDAARDV